MTAWEEAPAVERHDDPLKLENQLCFPLYACARGIIRQYKPFLDPLGLTYTQYIVMMVLWERGRILSKDLGRTLYLDSGTLTPLLKKLEAKGLVTRERGKKDERNLVVSLTEKGRGLKERAAQVPLQMSRCIDLTMEEAVQLYRILYKILNGVGGEQETSGE